MEKLELIINLIRKYYYKPAGLLVGILAILLLLESFNDSFSLIFKSLEIRIIIYVIPNFLWIIIWFYTTKYFPRVKEGKIGIVIAINTENEKQKNRIKVDFTKRLNEDLDRHNLKNLFHLLLLNDHQSLLASKILNDYTDKRKEYGNNKSAKLESLSIPKEFRKWKNFNKKIRGHFFIWGSIIERMEKEKKYLLDVSGLVIHRPLNLALRDKMKSQFLAVFPKEISFYEKFEISGFKFTADTIYIAARYITGLAALYSADPFIALKLHDGLIQEIYKHIQPLPPNLNTVKNNLVDLIVFENFLIAKYYYIYHNDVKKTINHLNKSLDKNPRYYDSLILKSYILFKDFENPKQSLKLLNLAGRYSRNNLTWLYNKAFLFMYLEKFEKGYKIYQKLEKTTFPSEEDVIEQVINFNEQLLRDDKNIIQCHFILGFLYWKKKHNIPIAFEHFEHFMNKSKTDLKYKYLYDLVESFLVKLKNQMKIE